MKIPFSKSGPQWLLTFLAIALAIVSARIPALHWLSFFWILPFAFALPRASFKQGIMISAFCGTVFWIGTTYWLIEANIYFAKSATVAVTIVFLLFCLWQALPYIVLGVAYSYFNWGKSPLGPLLAASTLTVAWIVIPTPIPLIPQNMLYAYPKFVAVLDLSGMSLLLFLSTLVCFAIEYSLRERVAFKKHYMALVISIPVLMLAYGEIRQIQLDHDKAEAGPRQWLDVGYIQPAIKYGEPLDRVYQLTQQLTLGKAPDLIVWPEITSPYSFIDTREDRVRTLNLVNQYKQDLVVVSGDVYAGEPRYGSQGTVFNQAQLIKSGRLQGRYSKEILVPFFEYMPEPLQFLRRWMPYVRYYRAGKDQQPLNYKENIALAMAICYEIIFPEFVRELVHKGGNIIINPSSDTIFGKGIGTYYHFSTAYFRSIENRVPWVRSTNTGISIIVGADGRPLTKASRLEVIGAGSARVFIPQKASIYSRFGDWFIWFLALVWLAYSLSRLGASKR